MEDDSESFLTPEAQVIALRTLGGIALASAGTALGAAAGSIIAPSVALIAIPAALLAGYLFWHSTQINDYDDSAMIGHLREKAQRMTLDEVVAQHGWKKILRIRYYRPISLLCTIAAKLKIRALKISLLITKKSLTSLASYNEKRSGRVLFYPPASRIC